MIRNLRKIKIYKNLTLQELRVCIEHVGPVINVTTFFEQFSHDLCWTCLWRRQLNWTDSENVLHQEIEKSILEGEIHLLLFHCKPDSVLMGSCHCPENLMSKRIMPDNRIENRIHLHATGWAHFFCGTSSL